jgi:hypothetical protein
VAYRYVVPGRFGGLEQTTTDTSVVAEGRPGEDISVAVAAVNALGQVGPYRGGVARLPLGSGYWLVGESGAAVPFGDAPPLVVPTLPAGVAAVAVSTTPSGTGLSVLGRDGLVRNVDAVDYPANQQLVLAAGETPAAIWARRTRPEGYWTVTNRGQIVSFGLTRHLGDVSTLPLRGPVVDGVASGTGAGYILAGADGGVFAFGDARFAGSMGGQRMNTPVVGIAADPDGDGYWLAGADGGVFAFDAAFLGSMGATPLRAPIVGIETYGSGYVLIAADGGLFVFGDGPFHGSLGGQPGARIVAGAAFAEPAVPLAAA